MEFATITEANETILDALVPLLDTIFVGLDTPEVSIGPTASGVVYNIADNRTLSIIFTYRYTKHSNRLFLHSAEVYFKMEGPTEHVVCIYYPSTNVNSVISQLKGSINQHIRSKSSWLFKHEFNNTEHRISQIDNRRKQLGVLKAFKAILK